MRPKYEREIEEILEKLDEAPAAPPAGRVLTPVRPLESPPRQPRRSLTPPIRLSPAGLMVAALVLAVVLFVASLALSITRLGRPRATLMWRGREMRSGGFLANSSLARQWRRWRARRRFKDTRWG